MRVLYVGMREAWGNVTRGVGYEERFFERSLLSLPGVETETFDYMAITARRGRSDMSRMLLRRVHESRPDVLFMVLLDNDTAPYQETIREITETTATRTMLWVCDDPWQFDTFSRAWAPQLDFIITTDPDTLPRYRALDCGDRALLVQWACHPDPSISQRDPDLDVSFVGQPHSNRREIVELLRASGVRIAVFGHGWGEGPGRLSYDEMLAVFRRSKINLNLGNAIDNASLQIKARNFEVPGCGGFLLTPRMQQLDRYLVDEREIATFRDDTDLVEKVQYYLANDEERCRIARQGWRRCLTEHSWPSRWRSLFARTGLSALLRRPAATAARQ